LRSKRFSYRPSPSLIFGIVRRPLVSLECYSERTNRWVLLTDLLADTGADVSILPRHLGVIMLNDIRTGKPLRLHGVVPGAGLPTFLHTLRFRVHGDEFHAWVAIAEINEVPPLLGRVQGLDRFTAVFAKGRHLDLSR